MVLLYVSSIHPEPAGPLAKKGKSNYRAEQGTLAPSEDERRVLADFDSR